MPSRALPLAQLQTLWDCMGYAAQRLPTSPQSSGLVPCTRWQTKGFQGEGNDNCFFGRPPVVDAVLSRIHNDQRAVYTKLGRLRLSHARPEKQFLAAIKLEGLPVVGLPGIVAAARSTTFNEARRALGCHFSTCHADDLVMQVLPSLYMPNSSCMRPSWSVHAGRLNRSTFH